MKNAGINWVFMGVETGTDVMLEKIGKKLNFSKVREAVKIARDAGMNIDSNYIF